EVPRPAPRPCDPDAPSRGPPQGRLREVGACIGRDHLGPLLPRAPLDAARRSEGLRRAVRLEPLVGNVIGSLGPNLEAERPLRDPELLCVSVVVERTGPAPVGTVG